MRNDRKILEEIRLPHGMEPDLDQGWLKIVSRQFGGSPGRGFCELIQNSIDSHSNDTPMEDRYAVIHTTDQMISITDWGEGMSLARIKLLVTLGGTDKHDDPDKLGKFGLGFYSIFNPELKTQKVRVVTKSQGNNVEINFNVSDPNHPPQIDSKIVSGDLSFSTKVEVFFENKYAVTQCLMYAREYLKYYPCRIMIGESTQIDNVWTQADRRGDLAFKGKHYHGFITENEEWVEVLCKYEKIITLSMNGFLNGGKSMKRDLRDYDDFPYLKKCRITVNYDRLDLTISRDSFYLNSRHRDMVSIVAQAAEKKLEQALTGSKDVDPQVILANQYIYRAALKAYLRNKARSPKPTAGVVLLRELAEAKVYSMSGYQGTFSLQDLVLMKSKGIPLFYTVRRKNLRWLGGHFKHDFVVMPDYCSAGRGAPDFYEALFGEIFGNVVNLDTIAEDRNRIHQLVKDGIVDNKAINPSTSIIGNRELNPEEVTFLREMELMLMNDQIKQVIERNLFIWYDTIETVYFDVDEEGVTIATGLFDLDCCPIQKQNAPGNENREPQENDGFQRIESYETIKLGIRLNHPFIRKLITSQDPMRAHYAVNFLAGKLASSQNRLTPATPFFNKVKEKLAADMRNVLIGDLYARTVA